MIRQMYCLALRMKDLTVSHGGILAYFEYCPENALLFSVSADLVV
jgi:hypothetical protein